MLAKYITAGLLGSALLATVAFAQNPTATTDSAKPAPAAASDSSFQGSTWRGSKLVGLSVYNQPVAYTGAASGPNAPPARPATTTGAANTNTAPASAAVAKPNPWYPDHAVFNATKDELKAMSEFKYST